MQIIEINDFKTIEKVALSWQKEKQAYVYTGNKLGIITPSKNFINIPKEDYEIFELKYIGGSIVVFPGDIDIVVFPGGGAPSYEIISSLYKRFCRELHLKGYNAKIKNNDLIIDNNGEYIKIGAMVKHFCHISVNTDTKVVQEICKKKGEKIPGKLIDFGFTPNEVYDIVINCLKGQ